MNELITTSLGSLEKWIEDHQYKGYEPFDGLSSFLQPLTFGTLLGDRLLMQLIRQSPVNLRPILGVKPKESTKGRGYMAWGYLTRYRTTGDKDYLKKAEACLAWLKDNKSPKFEEYSWGNHFAFAARGGRYSAQESISVWTSQIGMAYLDAFEITGKEEYLDICRSICRWILALPRYETETGTCLGYHALQKNIVHNGSMLGAAMLARTAVAADEPYFQDEARDAMLFSCSRQLDDGAWWYGADPRFHWIDNFHTGYNLDSLKCYIDSSGDETWRNNLKRGFQYFKSNFFNEDGLPKYYHNRAYPIDIQCASQAITTLSRFADDDQDSLDLAMTVALWTINNMQRRDGAFIYRIYPWGRAKTAMLHWGQATMYKGMTLLLSAVNKTGS